MSNLVFTERDANLKLMGFFSYEEYLASDLWAWVRANTLGSVKDKCECCLTTSGLCLHHRDYSLPVLCGNFSNVDRKIIRLCVECHRVIHADGKQWFEMRVVEYRLEELASRRSMVLRGEFSRSDLPTRVSEFDGYADFQALGGF